MRCFLFPQVTDSKRHTLACSRKQSRSQYLLTKNWSLNRCITVLAYSTPVVEEVRVDMADMKVESKNVELLTSVGSCVAICLHDYVHKCGGLAHIMLPNSANGLQEPLPSKFANTAVPALIKEIIAVTGKQSRLYAKIAGGANMFSNLGTNYFRYWC